MDKLHRSLFACGGVTIEDEMFVVHGVTFFNDWFPRATTDTGESQQRSDWELEVTRVRRQASIGSRATIICGLDVPASTLVDGVPPRNAQSTEQ